MKKNIIIACIIFACATLGIISCTQNDVVATKADNIHETTTVKTIIADKTFAILTDAHSNFSEVFHTLFLQTSKEDINSIINLGALYNTNPEEFGGLLEAKLKAVLRDDYDTLCELITQMKIHTEAFNNKFNLAELNKNEQLFINNKLALVSLSEEYVIAPKAMSVHGESSKDCASRCKELLDIDVNYANNVFACAAAVGVLAACTGAGIPWATVGVIAAAYVRDQAVYAARAQYDVCLRGC